MTPVVLMAGLLLPVSVCAQTEDDGVKDFPRFLAAARKAVPEGTLIDVRPVTSQNQLMLAFFFETPGGGLVEVRTRLPDDGGEGNQVEVQRSKSEGTDGRPGKGKGGKGKGVGGKGPGPGPGPGPGEGPSGGPGGGQSGGQGGKK